MMSISDLNGEDSIIKVENEILHLRQGSLPNNNDDVSEPIATTTQEEQNARNSKDEHKKYICHMSLCERKSFSGKNSYLKHLQYHRMGSAYGCSICHNLDSNVRAVSGHLVNKHGIKKHLCLNYVYVDYSEWVEPSEDVLKALPPSTTSSSPTNENQKKGRILIKYKKRTVHTIDVSRARIPMDEGDVKLREEVNAFVNDGLFDHMYEEKLVVPDY